MFIRLARRLIQAPILLSILATAHGQSCTNFSTTFVSPAAGFTAAVDTTVNIKVQVQACGSNAPITDAAVGVSFTNGDPQILLQSQGLGVYSGSWNPVNAAQTITLVAFVDRPNTNSGGAIQVGSVVVPLPAFTAASSSVSFAVTAGGPPDTQNISVINNTAQTQSAMITAGASWLSVSPAVATITAGGSQMVQVTVNPGGLPAGSLSGTIIANTSDSSGASFDLAVVNVAVSPPAALLQITASSASLAVTVAAGSAPVSQTVTLHNGNATAVPFSVQSTSPWLTVQPPAATLAANSSTNLTVTITPGQFAAGFYGGSLTIQPTGGTALVLMTSLNIVAPPAPAPVLGTNPNSLSVATLAGASVQNLPVTLTNPYPVSVNFAISSGAPWLSASPAIGVVAANGSMTVTVSVDPSQVTAGSSPYTSSLDITTSSQGSATTTTQLQVGLTVTGAVPASCAANSLVVVPVNPAPNSTVILGQPIALKANVIDNCGNPLAGPNSRVQAQFSDGGPSLLMAAIGGGTWLGTWTPLNSQPQIAIQILAVGGSTATIAGSAQVPVTVAEAGSAPAISSVVDVAAQAATTTVSPGEAITIYGSQLADCTAEADFILPEDLCGTQVLLGGVAVPLYYMSASQINAQVPFGLSTNSQLQLIVQRDSTLSLPSSMTVQTATPAVFTQIGAGAGPADVLNATSGQLITSSNPLHPGQAAAIYCSGLGAAASAAGTEAMAGDPASLSTLFFVASPVSATIGGLPAPVLFSGLAPGFIGLYQINVTIPTNVSSGQAALIVTVAGQASPLVTVAVQNP